MLFNISKIVKLNGSVTHRSLIYSTNHIHLLQTGIPRLNETIPKRLYSNECSKKDHPKAGDKPMFKKKDLVDAANIACPWEDVDKNWQDKLKKYKILAALLAAAALGYLAYFNYYQQKEKKSQEVKKERYFIRPQKDCRCPTYGRDFPKHVPYLLIGGGTASFAAFRAIKSSDPKAKVLVINNECNYPYMRPPLSKEMWFGDLSASARKLIFKQWNGQERSIFYEPHDFYVEVSDLMNKANGGVACARGWTVKRIDVVEKKVYLDDDTEIGYDKCLIATGSKPKNLPIFENANEYIKGKVSLFREVFDFQELSEVVKEANSIAIIGGGFLGSELACALGRVARTSKKRIRTKIFQIYREKGNMAKVIPEYLSTWATERVRREGVQICNNANVEDVSMNQHCELQLHLDNGRKITVDHVIVAVGVEPNTQLAIPSELETDPELGGYLVNTEMEARSNLYIAGDCSCFYDTKLGRRRVEHHDHAVVSGRLAGENMTGAQKPYLHQSMFWSDLGPDLGYEAIGIVDSSLPTVGVFTKSDGTDDGASGDSKLEGEKHQHDTPPNNEFNKGVLFYLKEDTVVGIVLWNIFNRMSIARQVLKDQKKYEDLNEVAKLFNIHDCDEDTPQEEGSKEEAHH